jgi:endonuclease/exonuclease/phosphatase (EEP) superfamily protein YafD
MRNTSLAAIAKLAASETNPVLVIGDLNTTERSSGYELLTPNLRDSRRGWGWSPSWGPFLRWLSPLNLLVGIPIDHACVSSDVVVDDRRLGPHFGSDHLPLSVSIAIPAP